MHDIIEWRKELETGIPGIDREHRELVASINALHQYCDDPKRMIPALKEVYDAFAEHFSREEHLMERYVYDQYREHKADHDHLLSQIHDLMGKLEKTGHFDEDTLCRYLDDWFLIHVKAHDLRLHNLHRLIMKDRRAGGVFATLFGEKADSYWGDE